MSEALVAALWVFSVCSILSGLAASFPQLLAARLIMGIAEGPLMPICLAMIAAESSPRRRGLNMGIPQSGAALIGSALAPIVLVPLAQAFSWRAAFFVAGIPGMLCAIAVILWVREPRAAPASDSRAARPETKGWLSALMRERNVWLCAGITCLMVSWLMLQLNFLPIFFTAFRGLTSTQMSRIMSLTGLCAMMTAFLGAAVSDRIGRKPVTVGSCLLSVLAPLSGLYLHGPVSALAVLIFIGWSGTAIFPQILAVIPGETLPARYTATAVGLIVGPGEVVGGVGAPLIGGRAADLTTLAAPIKLAAACSLAGAVLAFFLKETAPVKVGASAAMDAPRRLP